MTFPEHTLQAITGDWWERATGNPVGFGSLLEVFVHHMDKLPIRLVPEGRMEARAHDHAKWKAIPFNIRESLKKPPVPIAGLPHYEGESYVALRGKVRPALVVDMGFSPIKSEDRARHRDWQTAPVLAVAPFYGVEQTDKRHGYNPDFVERVQKAYYKQFFWDRLPSGALELCRCPTREGSLLRLDHVTPVGADPNYYRATGFQLNPDGRRLLREWLEWVWFGDMKKDSFLLEFRSQHVPSTQ